MKSAKSLLLSATVFATGSCVLILEILSTRTLAPYYGNTIFAFSTVIGVTLAALSIGYYVGGKLADARPNAAWFFGIITISGATVFVTKFLSATILPFYATAFTPMWGPLMFAVPLFVIPCALLGMLSPYAVRLNKDEGEGVGSASGTVFFWSTLGSIAGTFLAGFVLIPQMGVQSILIGVGGFLLVLGGVGMLIVRRNIKMIILIALCAIVSFALALSSQTTLAAGVVHMEEGVYETIIVHDAEFEGRQVRFLRQNANASAAMDLETGESVFDYMKYFRLPLALNPNMKHALVIGGGVLLLPRDIARESNAVVEAVDPEPALINIAKNFFNVSESVRLHAHVEDGRSFLQNSPDQYDLIYSDVYQNFHAIPPHLITKEFFEEAKAKLSDRGFFLVNFIGTTKRSNPSLLWSAVRTFRDVFPHSAFFAVSSPDSIENQNIIFLGCDRDECADPCSIIMNNRSTEFLQNACEKELPAGNDLGEYALLTDDYVPAEYLAAWSF